MTGQVRVLLYAVAPESDDAVMEKVYHQISRQLRGTPGLLGNELLRSIRDPLGFVVLSRWEDLAAFASWEAGTSHRTTTAPLRPLHDGTRAVSFDVYEVCAAY